MRVSAHANRVAVEHGHTVCMSVKLDKPATPEEALAALANWQGDQSVRGLPSAPERPLLVTDAPDRPQARRDVGTGGGMTVIVGRVRADPQLDIRLVALGHNTIRGAAGGSVLNAELLVATGVVSRA
jgi:aspartate-semialdehyde dehydrogenase